MYEKRKDPEEETQRPNELAQNKKKDMKTK